MDFTEILNPKTIVTHLNVSNKAEALAAMADLLVSAGNVNDKDAFLEAVYEREAVGETGVGDSVAIPHGKSAAVVRPGVAITVLDHEIEWESLDGSGARIVILFAVGADDEAAQEHLRLLAMFSGRLGDGAVIQSLLDADSVADVISAFTAEGTETASGEEADLDLDEITIL